MGSIASWIWVLIPLAAIAAGVFVNVLRHREKRLELEAQIAAAQTEKLALEQRVRVLERIVTDSGHSVADEIGRLRDERVS